MQRTKVADLLRSNDIGKPFTVKGWVRTRRGNKHVNFVALNDGSGINNLQVVVDMEKFDEALVRRITTGAAISVDGELQESQGAGQNVELLAKTIEILGDSDPDKYPLQPKKHSLEFYEKLPTCVSEPIHSEQLLVCAMP
ncbi:OB-fold nucleic acid binding domain-containing protein [Marinilabilia salmonicolor]|uniref:OB-fold nucleic acid binding domain-containing protein n=1 Tax=Marinilabilia salmonicolor TaxID=989 RepID=UPI000A9FDACB